MMQVDSSAEMVQDRFAVADGSNAGDGRQMAAAHDLIEPFSAL